MGLHRGRPGLPRPSPLGQTYPRAGPRLPLTPGAEPQPAASLREPAPDAGGEPSAGVPLLATLTRQATPPTRLQREAAGPRGGNPVLSVARGRRRATPPNRFLTTLCCGQLVTGRGPLFSVWVAMPLSALLERAELQHLPRAKGSTSWWVWAVREEGGFHFPPVCPKDRDQLPSCCPLQNGAQEETRPMGRTK